MQPQRQQKVGRVNHQNAPFVMMVSILGLTTTICWAADEGKDIPDVCMYVWSLRSEALESPKASAESAKTSPGIPAAAEELGEDVLKLLVLVP